MSAAPHPAVLPEGWRVDHSHQYNCPFYVNIHTNEALWTIPTAPALPAGTAHPVSAPQHHTSSSPIPKDAAQYPAGTTVIANGQPTPMYSPVEPAKQAYFPVSQNNPQANQPTYVHSSVPPSTPLAMARKAVPSTVNQIQPQLSPQTPGAASPLNPSQAYAPVVPVSGGTPIVGQRDVHGQPQTQGMVLQQQPSPVQQLPVQQVSMQPVQGQMGSATNYYTSSGPPQHQVSQPITAGIPHPPQQSGIPQPYQPGGSYNPPPVNNGPAGERGIVGDLMGSLLGGKPADGSRRRDSLLSSAKSIGSSSLFGGKKQAKPQQGPPTQQYPTYQQVAPPQQYSQVNRPPQGQQFAQGQQHAQGQHVAQGQQYAQGPPRPYPPPAQGPPRPGQQYPQRPPQQHARVQPHPQAGTPVAAAKPASTGQAALVGGLAGLSLGGLGAMALGKNSGTMGGLFGRSSSTQSGGQDTQPQQFQDPSQQTNGGNGYYDSSGALQQQAYADPSSTGGVQAPIFDPATQTYISAPTEVLYTDTTTVQVSYTDINVGVQQPYTDPSYGTQAYTDPAYNTQAYTDPAYDTTGQYYAPIDQSYGGGGLTYSDPTVDAAYSTDVPQTDGGWDMYNMDLAAAGGQQVAETIGEGGDGVLAVMDE